MKTILYVEDDAMTRMRAKSDIQSAFPQYNVRTAKDKEEGLNQLPENIHDLEAVCTDGNLFNELMHTEGSYGWDLAQEIKDRGFKGPIIYIGKAHIPQENKNLFTDESISKTGTRLTNKLKEYII